MKTIKTVNLDDPPDVSFHSLYEKHEKIYTRAVDGFYQRVRRYTHWPLLIGFFGMPWVTIHGRQAILFDLPARKFHVLWLTFWPQDFGLLAWALMIAAFSLFFVTSLLGRVWCGYTCPQTVWTRIFMWIEQLTEGDRLQRIHLDEAPLSVNKVEKRVLKHGLWALVALASGGTFISYFYGMHDLINDAVHFNMSPVSTFWVCFLSAATYVNAGWMREQVCIYMCPYARFQSAMFDRDTLIVSYDAARGEKRGARKKGVPHSDELGDCIDCTYCVQVCPTGIDIRDGLQYECINCALCVDACNGVMDRMGYERGLVRYTTENKLAGKGWTWKRIKPIGYGVAITAMVTVFTVYLILREP
ncbi:MAG TPA: cytochrome c oxidase accessory protein CcoG, partial [Pseudomonadales bacterium]|nr:cytochrome c oxidase accessory protein CcoG [Pseudomonadales bacterium]